jgi:hypothetical protein
MRHTAIATKTDPVAAPDPRRWRDLQFVLLGVVLLALVLAGLGQSGVGQRTRAEGLDKTALPKEISAALDRAARMYSQPLNGARWSDVHTLSGTDHPLYQLQGTNGRGNKIEIEVTSAGRIIEVEEHGIPLDEVPGVVFQALRAKAPQFKLDRAEAIYQNGGAQPVCYGFEGTTADGKKREIYISADGKTFLN